MDYASAKNYVLRRLARGSTTTSRLSRQLALRGADAATIKQLLEEMTAAGYLSDTSYSTALIEQSIRRGYGPAVVVGKLASRGIAINEAQALVAAQYLAEEAEAAVRELLKQPRYQKLPRPKLLATLQRRGFSISMVLGLLNE